MSFKHLSVVVAAMIVASACSKTSNDAPVAPVSVPDKPILNQPPSQSLTVGEYNSFRTFVANQETLPSFAPQDYVFEQNNESGLSPDQANLLSRIRTKCQNPKVETKPDENQPVQVGTVRVTTHSNKSSGPVDCPVNYAFDDSISVMIAGLSQTQIAMTGDAVVKESLSLTDWNVAPVVGTNQISADAGGKIAYIINQQEERMRISLSGHQIVSAFSSVNQPGHSEEVSADNITITKMSDGSSVSLVALNVTLNVPGLTKPVVVSVAGSVQTINKNSVITPTEFYVNHEAIPVMDQNSLLNSRLMKSILNKVVGEAHTNLRAKFFKAANLARK